MKSLANKEIFIEGNWYDPLRYFKALASVVYAELYVTSSSAGDWSGFFVQRMGKGFYDIVWFNQENRYATHSGYIVNTTLIGKCNSKPSKEEVYEFINSQMAF